MNMPHVIHTEDENERCIAELETLLTKSDRTPEELRLAELLTLLIEDFEDKHYTLPAASPLDIVRHLMDANNLRQVDNERRFWLAQRCVPGSEWKARFV